MKISKRLSQAYKDLDPQTLHPLPQAIEILQNRASAKFDETVEISVHLGVDPRHADQMVRGMVDLPNGTGKTIRVAVFAVGQKAEEAEQAGADLIGGQDLADKIQEGHLNFDRCIATPDLMVIVGKLGKILGPRGLMPNPKLGTVTQDVTAAIKAAKSGNIPFRVEKAGIVHGGIGKISFSHAALKENIHAFVDALQRAKPSGAKGTYLRRINLSSTMGPSLKVALQSVTERG